MKRKILIIIHRQNMQPQFITNNRGDTLTYLQNIPNQSTDKPGIVFLSGFGSDMLGTKAEYLHQWAQKHQYPYLRFDYAGHGLSSNTISNGSIAEWCDDAHLIITQKTTGKQILVGSSMGGWIALLLAKKIPQKISAIIGIAAAPDFTTEIEALLSKIQKQALQKYGEVPLYPEGNSPVITQKIITNAQECLIFTKPLNLPMPLRLMHGNQDTVVSLKTPLKILKHANGNDIQIQIVKGADHRFSSEKCLNLISYTIKNIVTSVKV